MAKVIVEKDTCIGCGLCVSVCPDAFEMSDGKAVALDGAESSSCVDEAIEQCPVDAIKRN